MADYTLVVGTRNWSSWSLRPFLALSATGAPFETVVIRLRQTDHPTTAEMIRKHSPAGKVPVLKIHDRDPHGDTLVWDSLAICETLAERHPDAQLWPQHWKARAHARALSAEMHSGYPDLRDQLTMDFARRLPLPDVVGNGMRLIERGKRANQIQKRLKILREHVQPLLVDFSRLVIAPTFGKHQIVIAVRRFLHLGRVCARPDGFEELLKQDRVGDLFLSIAPAAAGSRLRHRRPRTRTRSRTRTRTHARPPAVPECVLSRRVHHCCHKSLHSQWTTPILQFK